MTKQDGNNRTIYSFNNRIKRFKRDSNQWSIYALTIVVCIAIPIFTLLVKLFSGPGETWNHIVSILLPKYFSNTFLLIFGCSLLVLVIGISSAWIVSRYEFPFRKTLEWMLILPLAIPSYITAYSYAGFFDYGGTLEKVMVFFGLQAFKIDIMNVFGLILILSLSLYPYVYVSCRAIFLTQSNRLIEASKLLGANNYKTFFKLILPLSRPAIVGGLVLVLMEVLNDYGAAKYFGVSTFTTGIFRAWFALEEPETAVYLSVILVLLIFGLILIEKWQRRKIGYHNDTKNAAILERKKSNNFTKYTFFSIAFVPVFLGFLLPVFQLIYWAVLTYEDVLGLDFISIAFQSLGIAIISAVSTVIFALLLIFTTKWNILKSIRNLSKISTLGYAIPGAVIAVGVMIPTLMFDKWLIKLFQELFQMKIGLFINGTIIGLLYAYMVRFMAVGYNPIEANTAKIGERMSESSRMLGKNNVQTFFRINFPLIKKGVLSGLLLVFVDVMKELPLTLILKPYNISTLAVKAYEYASDELIAEASLPSLCIILTGILPIIFLNKLITK